MSLTYTGATTSLTSSVQAACDRTSTSEIVTVSRASPDKIETWATSNLAAGVSISLTNNSQASAVCMISSASAVVFTSTTNMDVVNLDTGYKANYTGVVATRVALKGQQCAALPEYSVAISTTNTTNVINRFNSSTFTAGQQTITALGGAVPITVVPLASSFLIGTSFGGLVEINPDFTVVAAAQIPQQLDNTTQDRNYPTGLSYVDGLVLINTANGIMYQMSWYTKTFLNSMPAVNTSSTNPQGSCLCNAASGTSLYSIFNTGTGNKITNYIAEIDYLHTPPKVRDLLFLNTNQNVIAYGIQGSVGWAVYPTQTLINFTIVPKFLTTQTPSLSDNNVYKQSRRIVLIESNGIYSVDSDTMLAANNNNTTQIQTGQSVLEIAFYGSGISRRGSVAKYTT